MLRSMAQNTIAYSTKVPNVSVFSLPKVGGVLEEQEVVMDGVDLAQPQGKGVQGLQLREETKNNSHNILYRVLYTVHYQSFQMRDFSHKIESANLAQLS
jgi:hypothetical protein